MFEVAARFKIREGELDGFKLQAAEMMRSTRDLDTKTLRYDWFVDDAGTECEARESYVEADGLLEHNAHVRDARDRLFRDHAYGHDMTIYGEPSPALAELIERMAGHVEFHRFSLLQSLGAGPEGDTPAFEAAARLKIRDGALEAFERQAAEVLRLMREADLQPLRYDWFVSDDGRECEVREAYESPDSLLARQRQVGEAKLKLFRECLEGHAMTFYGELSPALAEALQAMGTPYRRLSFLQGLHADIDVLDKVPA
jgi:quinol monooxygenase YgiN